MLIYKMVVRKKLKEKQLINYFVMILDHLLKKIIQQLILVKFKKLFQLNGLN